MRRIAKSIAMAAVGLLLGSAALGQTLSPEGVWTTAKGESRYQFFYCGDGSQLCVKLIWLSDKARADKPETVAYVDKLQVDRAKVAGNAIWKGKIVLPGHTLDGSIELTGADEVLIKGCEFFVLCADLKLTRYVEPS